MASHVYGVSHHEQVRLQPPRRMNRADRPVCGPSPWMVLQVGPNTSLTTRLYGPFFGTTPSAVEVFPLRPVIGDASLSALALACFDPVALPAFAGAVGSDGPIVVTMFACDLLSAFPRDVADVGGGFDVKRIGAGLVAADNVIQHHAVRDGATHGFVQDAVQGGLTALPPDNRVSGSGVSLAPCPATVVPRREMFGDPCWEFHGGILQPDSQGWDTVRHAT